jgi:hypothetical protein
VGNNGKELRLGAVMKDARMFSVSREHCTWGCSRDDAIGSIVVYSGERPRKFRKKLLPSNSKLIKSHGQKARVEAVLIPLLLGTLINPQY